ncbi:MAG: hypothetical protein AB9873_11205 [Syntrophobacteraceae bacterium]
MDLLTDYEGIGGYERFRGDLGLMYFAGIDPKTGALESLRMIPTRVRNFRIRRAATKEALWLQDTLNREGMLLGTRVDFGEDQSLFLRWNAHTEDRAPLLLDRSPFQVIVPKY